MTCPPWCTADHRSGREHVSAELHHAGFVIELIQYFDAPEPVVAINEAGEWTGRVAEFPLSLVGQLPAFVVTLAPDPQAAA
ncbi:hypothetical protein GCM10023322_15430 [Rugosimonospora acidiphila]|uniref:Uncharacterized protein n=1 Tax=Rugosimonospora acidiphila TaxID=556531 RepID=A0ABP9RME5_9ACTN